MDEQTNVAGDLGIKDTQEVAELVVAIVQGIHEARKDGKWDAADLAQLLPAFAKLGPALEGMNNVGKEIKDLDAEEIKKLASQLLAGLALGDGKVAIYVEEGFNVLVSIYKIIKAK